MVIYKATINSKVYIGCAIDLIKRKRSHKHLAKKPKTYFHRVINKYGWENVQWEVLYTTNSYEDLRVKEIYFIDLFKSNTAGYNLTAGGDGQLGTSYPAWNKGKKLSTEYRVKLSKAQSGIGNHNWGKRGARASSFTGFWVTPKGKFESLASAAVEFGVTLKTIRDRCVSTRERWSAWSHQKKL